MKGQQTESLLPSRRGQPLDGSRPAPQMALGLFLLPDTFSIGQLTRPRPCVSSSFKTVVLVSFNVRSGLSSYMPTTILICGSPADGFQIVGLFADSRDAESYAEGGDGVREPPESPAQSARRPKRAADLAGCDRLAASDLLGPVFASTAALAEESPCPDPSRAKRNMPLRLGFISFRRFAMVCGETISTKSK